MRRLPKGSLDFWNPLNPVISSSRTERSLGQKNFILKLRREGCANRPVYQLEVTKVNNIRVILKDYLYFSMKRVIFE